MVKMIEIVDSVEIFEDENGQLVLMQNVYELTEEEFERFLQARKDHVADYNRALYCADDEPSANYDVDD